MLTLNVEAVAGGHNTHLHKDQMTRSEAPEIEVKAVISAGRVDSKEGPIGVGDGECIGVAS